MRTAWPLVGAWGAWEFWDLVGGIVKRELGGRGVCGGGGHAISESEIMGAEDWEWGRSMGLVVEVR